LTGPHSYFGQQLAGSVPTTFAQAQLIAGQMLAAPVLAAAVRSQTGQVYVTQQLFGSMPFLIGVTPFGQTGANVGQATGLFGSQVGGGGDGSTHWPTHVRPLHAPLASQTQLLSVASQAQAAPGGGVMPVAGSVFVGVPVPVPPGTHPHSRHATLHTCPVGQSVFTWHPVCGTSGTQIP